MLEAENVVPRVLITVEEGTCYLWEETHTNAHFPTSARIFDLYTMLLCQHGAGSAAYLHA